MMKHFRYLFLFLLIISGGLVSGQPDAPVLRCVSVNGDGSVAISWTTAAPAPGFERYLIYRSTDETAPFTLIDNVTDESVTSYVDVNVNANSQVNYYFIRTLAGGIYSDPTDTLQTMMLILNKQNFETAELTWNALHDPLPAGSAGTFDIYREYPPGNWTHVGSTSSLQYTDQVFFCNEGQQTVNYRITLENSSGCQSVSVVRGDILYNYSPPPIPAMDSVSITSSGEVVLGWSENPAPDLWGYVIYRVIPGSNDSIDFVPGRDNTIYYFNSGDPCASSYSFAISAIDSCGNESPGTYDFPQRTLLVEDIEYDPCGMSNAIRWNGYINFDPPLSHYDIYVSSNGSPFTLLDNVNGNTTSYEHTGLQSNTVYEYFIRAVSIDGKTSSSCKRSVTTYDSPEPQFMYLNNVSVTADENVLVSFYTDTSAHVIDYKVFRSATAAGPFEEIGTVAPGQDEVLEFTDQEADVSQSSYYYKVTVIDSCQNESEIANTSRTIYLVVTANADRTNDLQWNDYSTWEGGVESYDVIRLVDGNVSATFNTGNNTYNDDVASLGGSGSISYIVEAHEGSGNPFGFRETSRSNEARALQESLVFVPNAFRPSGINNTFKPVTNFIEAGGYHFAIYNRWGQRVFETNNPEDAWDGRVNGTVADGVYVYVLTYRISDGTTRQKTGNVMVLQ